MKAFLKFDFTILITIKFWANRKTKNFISKLKKLCL